MKYTLGDYEMRLVQARALRLRAKAMVSEADALEAEAQAIHCSQAHKLLDGAQQGAPACPHCQADHKTQLDATTMGDLTAGQRCFLCSNCGKEYHQPLLTNEGNGP